MKLRYQSYIHLYIIKICHTIEYSLCIDIDKWHFWQILWSLIFPLIIDIYVVVFFSSSSSSVIITLLRQLLYLTTKGTFFSAAVVVVVVPHHVSWWNESYCMWVCIYEYYFGYDYASRLNHINRFHLEFFFCCCWKS